MHEYGIMRQIIKIVSDKAIQFNAKKVEEITLVVGELTGYIGDSMQMYFNICAENTICKDAILKIENIPAQWKCPKCNNMFTRSSSQSFACPLCGIDGNPTNIGKEFYIKSTRIIN